MATVNTNEILCVKKKVKQVKITHNKIPGFTSLAYECALSFSA
jgi:hypothetical protein